MNDVEMITDIANGARSAIAAAAARGIRFEPYPDDPQSCYVGPHESDAACDCWIAFRAGLDAEPEIKEAFLEIVHSECQVARHLHSQRHQNARGDSPRVVLPSLPPGA